MPEETFYSRVTSVLNGMKIQSIIAPPLVHPAPIPPSPKEVRRRRRKSFLQLLRKPFLAYARKDKELRGTNSEEPAGSRTTIETYSQYFAVDSTTGSVNLSGTASTEPVE